MVLSIGLVKNSLIGRWLSDDSVFEEYRNRHFQEAVTRLSNLPCLPQVYDVLIWKKMSAS